MPPSTPSSVVFPLPLAPRTTRSSPRSSSSVTSLRTSRRVRPSVTRLLTLRADSAAPFMLDQGVRAYRADAQLPLVAQNVLNRRLTSYARAWDPFSSGHRWPSPGRVLLPEPAA